MEFNNENWNATNADLDPVESDPEQFAPFRSLIDAVETFVCFAGHAADRNFYNESDEWLRIIVRLVIYRHDAGIIKESIAEGVRLRNSLGLKLEKLPMRVLYKMMDDVCKQLGAKNKSTGYPGENRRN